MFFTFVIPEKKNITPRYDQKSFDPDGRKNRWQTLISPGEPGTLRLSQQTWFSRIALDAGGTAGYTLHHDTHGAYVFLIEGRAEAAGHIMEKRDGLGVWETGSFSVKALENTEVLVIEVPMR